MTYTLKVRQTRLRQHFRLRVMLILKIQVLKYINYVSKFQEKRLYLLRLILQFSELACLANLKNQSFQPW